MSKRSKSDDWDASSSLADWLNQAKFNYTGQPNLATHLKLNGGKLQVADDKNDTFLEMFAGEIECKGNGRRTTWALHEVATRFFRFFVDLDIEETEGFDINDKKDMSLAYIEKMAVVIQQRALDYFPAVQRSTNDKRGTLIVLVAPSDWRRPIDKAGKALPVVRKTGLHLVFPALFVDRNQALDLRQGIIHALDERVPLPGGAKNWEKIFDHQVYLHSAGLRMPGSVHVKECAECHDREPSKKNCSRCRGRGREEIDRPYAPLLCLNASGASSMKMADFLRSNTLEMLKLCSIRAPNVYENDPPFIIPANLPTWAGEKIVYRATVPNKGLPSWSNAETIGRQQQPPAMKKVKQLLHETQVEAQMPSSSSTSSASSYSSSSSSKVSAKDLPPEFAARRALENFNSQHEYSQLVQRFLRTKEVPLVYRKLEVVKVLRATLGRNEAEKGGAMSTLWSPGRDGVLSTPTSASFKGYIYLVQVCGPGSRYCQNIRKEHKNRKIYFYLNYTGLHQKCFCRCPEIKENAVCPCKEFFSDCVHWDNTPEGMDVKEALFPYARNNSFVKRIDEEEPKILVRKRVRNDPYMSLGEIDESAKRSLPARVLLPNAIDCEDETFNDDADEIFTEEQKKKNLAEKEKRKEQRLDKEKLRRVEGLFDFEQPVPQGDLVAVVTGKPIPHTREQYREQLVEAHNEAFKRASSVVKKELGGSFLSREAFEKLVKQQQQKEKEMEKEKEISTKPKNTNQNITIH